LTDLGTIGPVKESAVDYALPGINRSDAGYRFIRMTFVACDLQF